VHEPKKEHAGQVQTLRTDSNRYDVVVIRQPPHLSTLHSPFRSIERYLRAIDLRQREPAADNADGRTDQKPQTEKVDRKDRQKRKGVLVNQLLEIHSCQLALDISGSIAYILDESILALWHAVAIIITAYGFVAQAICILVGPIFIPFFIVPKLEWLFWGWLKCFMQYAFYQVIAAATMFVMGNLVIYVLLIPNARV
jgi:type IV secretory pathway VirB6-like protein